MKKYDIGSYWSINNNRNTSLLIDIQTLRSKLDEFECEQKDQKYIELIKEFLKTSYDILNHLEESRKDKGGENEKTK